MPRSDSDGRLIGIIARYAAGVLDEPLPAEAEKDARSHLLDSLAASVSGAVLKPGEMAQRYVATQKTAGEATVLGTSLATSPSLAALANGMSAHADETDDSHEGAMAHIGCSVVPSVLAVGEVRGRTLGEAVRAVALGYDFGARVNMTIGIDNLRPWEGIHSSHGIAGTFGSAIASGVLMEIDEPRLRWVISYAAEQAAGLGTVFRDSEHVEKAFVFGGQPARAGVTAAEFVELGFSGVDDPFSGSPNYFDQFPKKPDLDVLVAELGSRFEVSNTNIKKFSVGSPMQSMLEALERLQDRLRHSAADVEAVEIALPAEMYGIVSGDSLPDVSARYLCAVTLLDGALTFAAAHDYERMRDSAVQALLERITLVADESQGRARSARVMLTLRSGEVHTTFVPATPGSIHAPMSVEEIGRKARSLLAPVVGDERAAACVELVLEGEERVAVRELIALCRTGGG